MTHHVHRVDTGAFFLAAACMHRAQPGQSSSPEAPQLSVRPSTLAASACDERAAPHVPPFGGAARLRPGCLAWQSGTEPNSGRTNLEEGGECWFCPDLAFLPSANVTQSPLSSPPTYCQPTNMTSRQASQRRSGGYQDKMRSLSPVKAIPWPRNLARSSISTMTSAAGLLLLSWPPCRACRLHRTILPRLPRSTGRPRRAAVLVPI
ncbi:hypothetical protein B0T11DRAFT_116757 [Plectosphaerella cucumerina]|uniref:Uncharacterized protein n=1 Tax=Plectosphaerella cucumerina TaxID=40658 RepID=A0A8K0WZD0_9PEZI|nr:hypothetical protein B0T11DRAFT_116757 [Plectosphaerella cucumerina]